MKTTSQNANSKNGFCSVKMGLMMTILIALSFGQAHAQQMVADTLNIYFDRSSSFNLEVPAASGEGYVFGTSLVDMGTGMTRSTDQIAMHYDGLSFQNTITDVIIHFGYLGINGAADILNINIQEVAGNSEPGNILSSTSFSTDQIIVGGETIIPLNNPTILTGEFFVVLDYAMSNDTIGVVSNDPLGDGLGEGRAYQRMDAISFSGDWYKAEELWNMSGIGGAGGQALDCDIMMRPIVEYDSNVFNGVKELYGDVNWNIYPNPSKHQSVVEFNLTQDSRVELFLMNTLGEIVLNDRYDLEAGLQQITIRTSEFPDGMYYVKIVQDRGIHSKLLEIIH